MPFVNIRITKEGATPAQKLALIEGATDLLSRVLDKDPATTFVIIDEVDTDSWGLNRESITTRRRREKAGKAVAAG
ncbi:4-oxalocrotonate tautomerase family protein [Oxalobacteraceae bacterium OTU3REALA1]|nr:4-oxalocrotonate tautomerase family protein [Oxalobacteraceae bacterium OTU3REALA1]